MENESRVKKTLLNARVGLIFYFASLLLGFFSRKIFLDGLGASFVGLSGTLSNILLFLNIAEMGVGAAVGFTLFKPIQAGDKEKIISIISVYGYFYRIIGTVIAVAGVILSLFIPIIFKGEPLSLGVIYFAFYSLLLSNLAGYFINYRQILLGADQKTYIVAAYTQTANVVKILTQMFLVYYYANYYLWLAVEFAFNVGIIAFVNYKIDKVYPWLKTSVAQGKAQRKYYPDLIKSTKQVFIHKIKDFLISQSDQILIFAFVSLNMVAYYGNYITIISTTNSFFTSIFQGTTASVGNLVAENDKKNILKVFWELITIRYFVAGFVIYCIIRLVNPFITLWLGEGYILSDTILYLLMACTFVTLSRGTVDSFNHAYGHYADIWSVWAEAIINLIVTIICATKWGLPGILIGKLSSYIPIIVIWKPIYLFRDGFEMPVWAYWRITLKVYLSFAIAFVLSDLIINPLYNTSAPTVFNFIGNAVLVCTVFGVIYLSALYFLTPGMRNLFRRLPAFFKVTV